MLARFYAKHAVPVPPKLLYFFLFLGLGMASPYYGLILKRFMDFDLVGLTIGLLQLCSFFGSPVWGFIADLTQRPRVIISCLLLVGFSSRSVLFFLKPGVTPLVPIAIMVFSELLGISGVMPLMDAFVLKMLGKDGMSMFGKQRVWGAVSWGIAAMTAGLLYSKIDLTYGLFLCLLFSLPIIAVLFISYKKFEVEEGEKDKESKDKLTIGQALRATKLTWQQWVFFFSVFFGGASMSSQNTFLFLYLEGLGGTELLFGLSLVTMIASEIPFMFYAGSVQRKIGTFSVVMLAFFCYFLRFVGYAFLPPINPWLVLIIEPLHGITFGVFYASAVSYVHSISNPQTAGTLQGIFGGIVNFGRATGSIGGGLLYKQGGGFLLFIVGAGVMGCVTALFGIVVFTDRGYLKESNDIEEEGIELIENESTTDVEVTISSSELLE